MGDSEKKKRNRKYIFDDKGSVSPHSDEFRRFVAQEFLSGKLTKAEIKKKYAVSSNSVSSFVRWYKKSGHIVPPIIKPMTIKEEHEFEKLKEQLKEAEKTLIEADLRIVSLETLINVAERELKITIRKKSGTKQS